MDEYSDEYVAEMKKFNEQGKILVFGEFNHDMGGYAPEQIQAAVASAQRLGRDHALFIIDSTGGRVDSLQRFLGAMHMFRPSADFRFVGFVAGQAGSAAFILLQHCEWRVAHLDSTLLVHYGSSRLNRTDMSHLQVATDEALQYERLRNREMLEYMARRSGKCSVAQIHALCKADLPLTASQCLAHGFLDEVLSTMPQVSVRPDYSITT
jgi:ATP-dependent protease ClpP protease subunit